MLAESDGLRLLENPRALPRAFVPRRVRAEPDPARRLALLGSIRDFSEQGVVEESGGAGDWTDNGTASLRIVAYGAQRLELDVDAAADTLVATSIPAWRGWKASSGSRGLATVGYNHAFVGVRVPRGRHRVVLRFAPDSVRYGLGISAATLLIGLLDSVAAAPARERAVILLVLRTLAVYAATAGALLWLARRFVVPLRWRIAVLLAAAPLLFTGKALLTGGVYGPVDITLEGPPLSAYRSELGIGKTRNPLLIDVASQMLPWRQAVRESVANGRLPLWNRFLLGGEPLLGVGQPAIFHPGTWIGFLLPLPQAWSFDMTLRIFLGVLCAYLFFAGTGASEVAALLGGLAWAFSDFLMFFVGYPVTPSIAPFPLLLLAHLAIVPRRRSGRPRGS